MNGEHLFSISVPYVLPILTAGALWLLHRVQALLAARANQTKALSIMEKLLHIVETVVNEATAPGLPASDPKALGASMLDRVKKYLGETGLLEIEKALGIPENMVTDYLMSLINSQVVKSLDLPTPVLPSLVQKPAAPAWIAKHGV